MKKIIVVISLCMLCVLTTATSYLNFSVDTESDLTLSNVEAIFGAETGVDVSCYRYISGDPSMGDHLLEARYCGECLPVMCANMILYQVAIFLTN